MLKDKIILIALNKPKGFICSHKDEYNRRKAIDLIPKRTLKTINGCRGTMGQLSLFCLKLNSCKLNSNAQAAAIHAHVSIRLATSKSCVETTPPEPAEQIERYPATSRHHCEPPPTPQPPPSKPHLHSTLPPPHLPHTTTSLTPQPLSPPPHTPQPPLG